MAFYEKWKLQLKKGDKVIIKGKSGDEIECEVTHEPWAVLGSQGMIVGLEKISNSYDLGKVIKKVKQEKKGGTGMKKYNVQYVHVVEKTVSAEVIANSEEEAIEKAKNGDMEGEEIIDNEQGIETRDYKVIYEEDAGEAFDDTEEDADDDDEVDGFGLDEEAEDE